MMHLWSIVMFIKKILKDLLLKILLSVITNKSTRTAFVCNDENNSKFPTLFNCIDCIHRIKITFNEF